ncbi:MAG: hypothetical protein JRN20_18085, partial [Nitrososphaerota archaeon]|nr:hypothetical protein [Nitrososphaerota archaeon]
ATDGSANQAAYLVSSNSNDVTVISVIGGREHSYFDSSHSDNCSVQIHGRFFGRVPESNAHWIIAWVFLPPSI